MLKTEGRHSSGSSSDSSFLNLQKSMTKTMKLKTRHTHTPRMYTPMYYEPQNIIDIN